MPPGEQLSSKRGRLAAAPIFVVTCGAVQNALARRSPVSLAKLDLSHLASSGRVQARPCAGVVATTSFGPRAARKSWVSAVQRGERRRSQLGRRPRDAAVGQEEAGELPRPGRRARPGPRRSAGRPVAAARAERRSASLLALLSSSSTRSLACEARSLAVCCPLRRHPRPHALWLAGPLPLRHAVASAQPPPTPALSLVRELPRSPHRRLAHARLTARLHLLPNRAAPRTPRGPRLPSRLLRLPSRPRPLPRGARAARAPSPAVRALVGPSRW